MNTENENLTAAESMGRIAELVELLTAAHFGDTAGFVLLITHERDDGRQGSAVRVAANLCPEHVVATMFNVGRDYAERHGVTVPDMPLTPIEDTDEPDAETRARNALQA